MGRVERAAFNAIAGRAYAVGDAAPGTTDCSRFIGAVARDLFGDARVDPLWGDLMITGSNLWSGIDAIAKLSGYEVRPAPEPGVWSVVQRWAARGHNALWWEPPMGSTELPRMWHASPLPPPWEKRIFWPEFLAGGYEGRAVRLD